MCQSRNRFSNQLYKCLNIGENLYQSGKQERTERLRERGDLLTQSTHQALSGSHFLGIGSDQILCLGLIDHREVAKIGLQFLTGFLRAVSDTVVRRRDFELRVNDSEARLTDRLDLACDSGTNGNSSVLEGLVNVVVASPNVVGQLRVVHRHLRSVFGGNTIAFQHGSVNGGILHELLSVDLHFIVQPFNPLIAFLRRIAKRTTEAVHDTFPLGSVIHEVRQSLTDTPGRIDHGGDFNAFQRSSPRLSTRCRSLDRPVISVSACHQPLNFRRKCRKPVGHLLHFIGKRLHGGGKSGHLLCKLVNVRRFQILDHLRQLGELIDKGGHIGLTQLGERA